MQHKQFHGRRFFAKAAIATTAALVGCWFAIQPLVSLAQEKPQQKSASAPAPASADGSKEKTVSFSDAQGAQQSRDTAKAGGKQLPSQPRYDSTHPYAGVRRILVELAGQPDSAQFYAHKYVLLVDEIAAALQDSLGASGVVENRQLLSMLWKIMQSRFYFADDTKFISNSLLANLWDCDNSAAVAYDVLRKFGFSPETISLAGHLLLKNGPLDFETKTGTIYSHDSIGFYYPPPVSASGADAFIALAHFELGNIDLDSSRFESAIRNYKKAISINSRDPDSHNNLGWAYESMGKYENALAEYSIAIGLSPKRGIARLNRANLYEKLGRENEAQADRDEYYGVKGVKVIK
ncbi:MAG: tetratricopeptide repeat protein [Candidatus Micrarchaeia archaeon]|jgi:tetratricopeptide (TPR) repeat protein